MTVRETQGGKQWVSTSSAEDHLGDPASLPPNPVTMIGLWTSWLADAWKLAHRQGAPGQASLQMLPGQFGGGLLYGGVRQLGEMLAKDPVLHAAEEALNANPLREVIPLNWAEIVRALRTVWLHSLASPDKAMASVVDLNMRLWQSTADIWNEAGQRWLELARPDVPSAPANGDKRFAAPEWHSNPVYRTLKEVYLLASDWLLRQASDADDISPEERQRVGFHLRQFVDAMSPTLMLASNPAALRRAMETGGASLSEGVRNLLHDIRLGKLSMVDTTAYAPGWDSR